MLRSRMENSFLGRRPSLTAVIAFLISSLLILAGMQTVQLQSLSGAFQWIFTHPLGTAGALFLLTLAQALVFALTKSMLTAYLIPCIIGFLLQFISYFKSIINSEPLLLSDFSLAAQFGDITGYAKNRLQFSPQSIGAIVIFVLTAAGMLFIGLAIRKKITKRAGICWLAVTLCIVLIAFVFPSFSSLSAAISKNEVTQEERNDEYGVLYGLYCTYASVKTEKNSRTDGSLDEALFEFEFNEENEETDASDAEEPVEVPAVEQNVPEDEGQDAEEIVEEEVIPNVIFVMSESFFDITRLPNLTFDKDPLENYHALAEKYTSGSFMTPAYCGGTAYVEMEVLTGLTSHLLYENDTLTNFPMSVYSNLPTVPDTFADNGYDTIFFHSHTNVLYNRDPIYHAMRFDKILFSDACGEDAEKQGGYVSDAEFARKIISLYEERDTEKPLFMMNVSMENHQPYVAEKYAEPSGFTAQSDRLNETDLSIIDSYVMGVHHADESLGMLTDYFSQVEEPVMLVFWGDHLPNLNLSDGNSIFKKLGYASNVMTVDWSPEELSQMLSTEYLIWTNYEEEEEQIPDHTESCTFLGIHVLEHLGFELNPYFNWLKENVMPNMTIYRARLFVDGNGNPYREIPEEYQKMMEAYKAIEQDLVYGERRILKESSNE